MGSTGAPVGSYLKAKGLVGRGLDVVGLETTDIEFYLKCTWNSGQLSTFLLCSEPSEGHKILS